jgi:hypothetical protein
VSNEAPVSTGPQGSWWWKLLSYVRQLWNALAAAGVAPSQKNDPSDFRGKR